MANFSSLSSLVRIFKKFQKMLIGLLIVVLLGGLGYFLYTNLYLTIIAPKPLDVNLVERRQSTILTEQYEKLQQKQESWKSQPPPSTLIDIFHR